MIWNNFVWSPSQSGDNQVQHVTFVMCGFLNMLVQVETMEQLSELCGVTVALVFKMEIEISNQEKFTICGSTEFEPVHHFP